MGNGYGIDRHIGMGNRMVWSMVAAMTLAELLDWARGQVRYDGDVYPPLIDAFLWCKTTNIPFHAFIYHVSMPNDAPRMSYPDMAKTKMDYDYDKIVAHAMAQVSKYGGQPILVNQALYPFNVYQPMYERCRAMCAYAHSAAFNAPTLFLDGDAFLNGDPNQILAAVKDIGVTYRNNSGLMPLNEGVIFAQPTEATRAFFRAYLATYEHLAQCPEVIEHYGDIKPWRGGQLSLNALASMGDVHDEMDCNVVAEASIRYLPCDIFNYAIEIDRDISGAELDQKLINHLKGPRKRLVDQVIAYQAQHK